MRLPTTACPSEKKSIKYRLAKKTTPEGSVMAAASLTLSSTTRNLVRTAWSRRLLEALRTISEIRIEICWRKSMTGVCFCWKDTTWLGSTSRAMAPMHSPPHMMGVPNTPPSSQVV